MADLRKLATNFPAEIETAVKQACDKERKDLEIRMATEKQLADQQHNSETAILKLKLDTLTVENTRLFKEIDLLKHQVQQSSDKLKDMAVVIIESGSTAIKNAKTDNQTIHAGT